MYPNLKLKMESENTNNIGYIFETSIKLYKRYKNLLDSTKNGTLYLLWFHVYTFILLGSLRP